MISRTGWSCEKRVQLFTITLSIAAPSGHPWTWGWFARNSWILLLAKNWHVHQPIFSWVYILEFPCILGLETWIWRRQEYNISWSVILWMSLCNQVTVAVAIALLIMKSGIGVHSATTIDTMDLSFCCHWQSFMSIVVPTKTIPFSSFSLHSAYYPCFYPFSYSSFIFGPAGSW